MTDGVEEDATCHGSDTVEAVKGACAAGLLCLDVPHAHNHHEARGDDGLEDAEKESADGHAREVGAGGGDEHDRTPDHDEIGHDATGRVVLSQITRWPLGN